MAAPGATGYRGLAPAARPRGAARPREGRSMCIGAVWRSRMGGSGGRGAGSGSAGGRCCRCFFGGEESWNAMDPSKCVRVWVSQRWPVAKVTTSRAADSCAGNQYDSPAARTRAWGPKVYGTSRVFRNIRVFTRSRFDAVGHTAAWLTAAAPSRNVYASARPHRSVGVTGSRRGKHRRLAGWRLGKAAATGGA